MRTEERIKVDTELVGDGVVLATVALEGVPVTVRFKCVPDRDNPRDVVVLGPTLLVAGRRVRGVSMSREVWAHVRSVCDQKAGFDFVGDDGEAEGQ